ncbi:EAL domain-containing protein [Saccharothrix sp. Mg75]|uniref:EAL domain-containing protein n=1 Tax=Saccharothrix sp. Mg75 TaxID=3445357 RepID=UPI003EEAFAF6
MSPPVRTRRQEIARAWMRAVYPTAYVPLSPVEIELFLLEQVDVIADAVQADPFTADPVDVVGHRLVRAHFTGPKTLQRTVDVLGHALLFTPELRDVPALPEKVVAILGSLAASFATAMRLDAFDQQEEIKRALVFGKRRAERGLRASEARFREVFETVATGMVVADLDGTCVQANAALAEMLDLDRSSLPGTPLAGLFHPEDAEALAARYRAVAAGGVERFRERRRLRRADGEPVWAHLAVSLLRDEDGRPAYHVTMADDVSELHLLQKNLDHQLLHDSLTGLANRQLLAGRLEALHGSTPGGITLYHLDLDAFSLVDNGLGHAAGDRLLQEVARRLEAVVAEEKALVARVGDDEFAVLVENSPTTPAVPDLVERFNEALARPGEGGVALPACTGVVDRPAAGWDVAEVLRAANATARRAKACGTRQWQTYDRHEDQRTRRRQATAARMPGALADGELEVWHQPVVALAGGGLLGHVVRVRWPLPDEDLGHDECVALAEAGGLTFELGRWSMREAAGEVTGASGALHVVLSPTQSRDEDLVRTVKRTLDETGLPAERLRVFLDTRSVLAGYGEDNAQVLRDNGIATGLAGFDGGQAELALLAELPVDALLLDPSVVRRLADRPGSFLHRATTDLVALLRDTGVSVLVPDVATAESAAWWARAGADAAFGDHLGPPVPGYDLP